MRLNPPRTISQTDVLGHFRPGAQVYIPGATGELAFLRDALSAEPDRLTRVDLVSCLVPGMNAFDYASLNSEARLTTFMLPPALRPSFEAGRTTVMPLAYAAIAKHLAARHLDIAIVNITPAQDGLCSLGTCADFGTIAARAARVCVGVINSALPRPVSGVTLPLSAFDAVVEVHEPPAFAAAEAEPNADLSAIAHHVASLVPDGAAVQTGIGTAPAAVWEALSTKRDLRLRSGMVTNGFLRALDAGALAPGGHIAGVAFGDAALFARLDRSDLVRFAAAPDTHGVGLNAIPRFFAINSAIEVDLLGQANLEWIGDRLVSGVGGAPDFTRAALASPGGRAILALPSTARSGSVSRIVTRLRCPAASLPREMADTVVTEHGVAELANLSLDARAEALITIAAPGHRNDLTAGWRELRASF
jgi:acyl-CoA hydrolase